MVALLAAALGLSSCTVEPRMQADELDPNEGRVADMNPKRTIQRIHPAIPVYAGAQLRADLTKRDEVEIRRQFGVPVEVYTLGSDDAFAKVWHYYVTYLGQYRGFHAPTSLPPEGQNWRTMQINLNTAMRDPFVPDPKGELDHNVLLQLTESSTSPRTVIRYIITAKEMDQVLGEVLNSVSCNRTL